MAKTRFEDQMKRLEEITGILEEGKTDIDESIKLYEEGLKISKALKAQLKEFEARIEDIRKDNDDE